MKVELNIDPEAGAENSESRSLLRLGEREEPTIDITQVLAASQALLKNMLLKMESLERKLESLEVQNRKMHRINRLEAAQRKLFLETPKEVKAWEPAYPKLDESYFSRFGLIDSFLFPEKLRRGGVD